ncbi:MAG: glycosyl hydrolase 53 family protein [Candidatus Micrarchaeota archaeon]
MKINFTALLVISLLLIICGCAQKEAEAPAPKYGKYTLPISERDYYIGVIPTPKSVPPTTQQDLINAYAETGKLGEVSMVWPSGGWHGACKRLQDSRTVEAVRNMGLKPIINLNFYTIAQVPAKGLQLIPDAPTGVNASLKDAEFRRLFVEEARNCSRMFKPEYLSLGNEVGAFYATDPDAFDDYVSLYGEAYDAVKQESPDTKVFVVFSQNQLEDANQWQLIGKFGQTLDLLGITTYPWMDYSSPDDIPDDFYKRLQGYTNKPIAFTEIGWVSASSAGSSEAEQAEYLVRFLNLTKGMDVEMANWLFLYEPANISGVAGMVSGQETKTIALKNADGTEKEIYWVWKDLYGLPLRK